MPRQPVPALGPAAAAGPQTLLSPEWDLIVTSGANVLIVADEPDTRIVLRALEAALGDVSEDGLSGTMVLRNVDSLPADEQRRLLSLLASAATPRRVISTASAPLFPMVCGGRFDADLYYRLNVVYIDLRQG